jgi:hypothetical protein
MVKKVLNIPIVSDEEAEKADFVVCVRSPGPKYFPDNEYGHCVVCGHLVTFRPYMPKKPQRLCLECFADKELGKTH